MNKRSSAITLAGVSADPKKPSNPAWGKYGEGAGRCCQGYRQMARWGAAHQLQQHCATCRRQSSGAMCGGLGRSSASYGSRDPHNRTTCWQILQLLYCPRDPGTRPRQDAFEGMASHPGKGTVNGPNLFESRVQLQ